MSFFSKLKKYKVEINGQSISFKCNNNIKIVNFFIELMKSWETKEKLFYENSKIKINWSYYVIKEIKNEFVIFAVDYLKNPFEDITEDLTLSLNILQNQSAIINMTKLNEEETDFQQTLVVKKSALNSNKLYLLKQESTSNSDSGWFLGDINNTDNTNDPNELMCVKEYELLKICPCAVYVMNLPLGTLVTIIDKEINTICDANNNEVYNKNN